MNTAFIFLLITLLLCYFVVRYVQDINYKLISFGNYLSKNVFPSFSDQEHNKFAILRMFFGTILVVRSIHIAYFLLPSEYGAPVGLWVFGELIAGVLLTLGLFTQWAFAFLMVFMWRVGDFVVIKYTLGNDVSGMLSLLLVLTNSGKYLSIDRILISRTPFLRKVLLYYSGDPTPGQLALAKLIALMSYWALCVYSIAQHIGESAWTSGVAGPLLLTSNFMSAYYTSFEALFFSSAYSIIVAKASLWIMMFWYPVILPFVFMGKILRGYVIIWGILFFILSLVALNLGYLAEIEFVLWAGIFWSCVGIDQKKSLLIFYDDRCNLCDKTIQTITYFDVFKRVKLMPISTNTEALASRGIKLEDAMNDLYGVIESKDITKRGYDFYILLSQTLVLFWPILPFLYLGKILRFGPLFYRYIARRRTELFGVCELPRNKYVSPELKHDNHSLVVNAFFLQVSFLTICYFAVVPVESIGIRAEPNIASKAARYYGIAPINVFNKTDLKMAENWFVLDSNDFNERVPVFTDEGSRLRMHQSDRVIFGNTGLFRRGVIGSESCSFEAWQKNVIYLSKVYLHLKNANFGTYFFTYKQFHQPLPDWDSLENNIYKKNDSQIRCVTQYTVDYSG